MTFPYVDSLCLVALAFDEPGARKLATRLRRFARLFSSNLLQAELRSALAREEVDAEVEGLLSWLTWVPHYVLLAPGKTVTISDAPLRPPCCAFRATETLHVCD